jgi:hypothetical protein
MMGASGGEAKEEAEDDGEGSEEGEQEGEDNSDGTEAEAEARAMGTRNAERVCCLLVLDSVTSTPQWIRQPKPRDVVHKVCAFVCECVLGSPRASQPLNIQLCLF